MMFRYYYLGKRLKLKERTKNRSVCAKTRTSVKLVVLMDTKRMNSQNYEFNHLNVVMWRPSESSLYSTTPRTRNRHF